MTKIPFHNKLKKELEEAGIELLKDVPATVYQRRAVKLAELSVKKALQMAADPDCRVLGMKGQAKAAQPAEKPSESTKSAPETAKK